jgi:hypothetical protein
MTSTSANFNFNWLAKIASDRGFDGTAVDGRNVRVPDTAELGPVKL